MNYREILLDPRWQKKRLEVLQERGFKCEDCGDEKKTLHVHHRYYVSHRMPWHYPPACYQVLCKDCHASVKDVSVFNQNSAERLDASHLPWEEWEIGLNYFGVRKIFEMAADANLSQLPDEVQKFLKISEE